MTNHELQEPAPERKQPALKRHRRTLIGVSGAAVVLAGGGLMLTQARDDRQESLHEPPSIAAVTETPSASASAATAVSPQATMTPSEATPGKSEPAVKADEDKGDTAAKPKVRTAEEAREEIRKARAEAKKDGIELQRPVEDGVAAAAKDSVAERTERMDDSTVRIATARHDLTGQSSLRLAGDKGKSVGDGVSCTNRIRFSRDVPASVKPTVLLCWRTSKARSVITMMATPNGEPSAENSIAIINREWAKLR